MDDPSARKPVLHPHQAKAACRPIAVAVGLARCCRLGGGSDECSTEQHLFTVAAHSSRYRCLLLQGPGVAFQCRSCFSVPQSRLPRQLAAKSRLPYLSAPRAAHRHRLAVTPHLSSPSSRPSRDARHVHDTSPITCAADLHQLPLLNLTRLPRPRSSPLLKPWRQAWT
jgi:hypothetical protein